MTEASARTTANVVIAAAGFAAAYVIVTTPPLRRLVVRGVQFWLGATVPVYFANQVRHAWVESARSA
ncbi:MAG TPA: hypothetical protein VGI97_01050 [Gemmatimonadaceae bacterium]|jgi:hypothetical protein